MQYTGFWKRFLAYIIDMIPIFIIVFCVFYFFLDFDKALHNYFNGEKSIEANEYFLSERNKVRDSALLLWIFYGFLMDCSKFQGTHGKLLLKLKVVSESGERITLPQSISRTLMKVTGALPFFLGYIWAAFRGDKATWHDLTAKTRVVDAKKPIY